MTGELALSEDKCTIKISKPEKNAIWESIINVFISGQYHNQRTFHAFASEGAKASHVLDSTSEKMKQINSKKRFQQKLLQL